MKDESVNWLLRMVVRDGYFKVAAVDASASDTEKFNRQVDDALTKMIERMLITEPSKLDRHFYEHTR